MTVVSNGSVRLGSPAQPALQLSEREQEVLRGLQESGAGEAPHLIRMLLRDLQQATTDAEREAALVPYEKALAQRGQSPTMLGDLLVSMLNFGLGKASRNALLAAGPWVSGATAVSGLVKAIYSGSWRSVTGALTLLAPLLPSLRNIEQVDQLILALPEVLRNQLDALHQQIQQMDDALTPDLGIRELVPALLIYAALWSLQNELPAPSRKLSGWAHSVSRFPEYWQRFVAMGQTGSSLFAPAGGPSNVRLITGPEDGRIAMDTLPAEAQEKMIACMRAINLGATQCDFDLDGQLVQRNAASRIVTAVREDGVAEVPGKAHRGGSIAPVPETKNDAAASSPAAKVSGAWAAVYATFAALFGQRLQTDGTLVEMVPLKPATQGLAQVTAHTPLVGTADTAATIATTATTATKIVPGAGIIARNPLKAVASVAVGFGGLIAGLYYLLSSQDEEPSALQLAGRLPLDIVSIGKDWGTGTDLLLGPPALPGKRDKRETADTEEDDLDQLGLSAEQRASVLADSELTSHLRTLQVLTLATAQDVAAQDGWQWVGHLVASEQELLVSQLYVLHSLAPALNATEAMPQTLLDDALLAAGWEQGGTGITVDLGRTRVAGVEVQQQIPLLQYCLLRAADTPPSFVAFSDSTGELSAAQQKQLRAFIASAACTDLQVSVDQHSSSLRPLLQDALRARLIIAGLQAKSQGVLGSGDMPLRGADIVLGFLQGAQDVESSTLTYVDTLADGTKVSLHVPNYLVLRSASTDPALRGQVVVYRADLSSFRSFGSERDFRQYLDAYRASGNLHVVDGALDAALMEDIIAAAPPLLQPKVRERIRAWSEGQALFQAGKGGSQAWNARESFQLDFKSVDHGGHRLSDWTSALVDQGQQREQQQMESNRQRWTPLGIANTEADAAYARHLQDEVMTLHAHARPALTTELVRALRNAGHSTDLQDFNPDRIRLRVDGHRMSLTEWAVSGWQQQDALRRPVLPVNLGDAPDVGIGLPAQPLPDDPWPSTEELYRLNVTVDASNDAAADQALTRALHGESALRAICTVMEELADSNRLAEAYIAHLKRLVADRSGSLHTVVANHVRTHLSWMIENAHRSGQLNAATYAGLTASHAALEPTSGRPSSLKAVTLNGHVLNGLWALAAGVNYVFVPGTASGDQLMTESDFRLWLQRPDSETYVLAHAALRHHADLEAVFRKRSSRRNLPLDFAPTRGPQDAARRYLEARASDADQMTVSELERFTQALTVFGSIVAAASCTLASGGSMLALCVTSTLALFAKGLHDGVALLERGSVHVNDAIESIGGPLVDLLDVLNFGAMFRVLHELGRSSLDTVKDARKALDQLRRQARGFSADGRVNAAFAVSSPSLRDAGLPMLYQGDGIYLLDGKRYVRQDGAYLQVVDDAGTLRLVNPDAPGDAGAPMVWDAASESWRREPPQQPHHGATTLGPRNSREDTRPQKPEWVEGVPQAGALSTQRIADVEAVFGLPVHNFPPPVDVHQVVLEMNIQQRVEQIVADPTTLGLPGDEAVIVRAWSDSATLSNGMGVETHLNTPDGDFIRGARFGSGPVGLVVEVDDTGRLPDLSALVDAAGADVVAARLGLPTTVSRSDLLDSVRTELAHVITKNPQQSMQTWRRWVERQVHLPTAADNLVKHYPSLTRLEATDIISRVDRKAKQEIESWIFGPQVRRMADIAVEERRMRVGRQAIVNNDLRAYYDVNLLVEPLQNVVPGRGLTLSPDGNGGVLTLAAGPGGAEGRVSFLHVPGQPMRITDATGTEYGSWQEAVFSQLTASDRRTLVDPAKLRGRVLDEMKQDSMLAVCSLARSPASAAGQSGGVGVRRKRAAGCQPPVALELTPEDVLDRDALATQLVGTRRTLDADYLSQLELEWERKDLVSKQMRLKDQKKEKLDSVDAARLQELNKAGPRALTSYPTMNVAHYRRGKLQYDGKDVAEMSAFPQEGSALSTFIRDWMKGAFIHPEPNRGVFLPEAVANGRPVWNGMFREEYFLGADMIPFGGKRAEMGSSSNKITFTEPMLQVTSDKWDKPRALHDLSLEEIAQLTPNQLSPELKKLYGDTALLPVNAKALTPGDYYMYLIRSCSESKILGGISQWLKEAVPALGPTLRGTDPRPNIALSGSLDIISDMNPCSVSCDRRLTELTKLFPNMKIKIYYVFNDPKERQQFYLEEKLRRVVQLFQDAGAAAGEPMENMLSRAAVELKKPETARRIERDMLLNPPVLPVPRVWTPQVQEAF